MTRKRILALMLTTLYVFCCFFTNAYSASNGSVSIIVGSVEGTRGEIINVPVSFKGVGSQSINNCDFRLKFDSNVLEAVEVTPGAIVKNAASNFSSNIIESSSIHFIYVDNSGFSDQITSDGLFANVKFRIKANAALGKFSLSIKSISFGDIDLNEIRATAISSIISIVSSKVNTPTPTKVNTPTPTKAQDIIVKVGSVQGKAGQTVKVPISFIGVPEVGLNNCEFRVSFDSTKLKVNSVVAGSIIKNSSDFDVNSANGFIKILFNDETQGKNQITEDGIFADLNFTIKDEADSGDCLLNFSQVEFADYDLNILSAEIITGVITVIKNPNPTATPTKPVIQDMNVVIGSAKGYAGEIVTIPISFEEVPEKGVDNCDFIISYDSRVLEAVDVKAGSIVESAGKGNAEAAGNFSYNVGNIGKVMLMYTDNKPEVYPITDRGEFAKVIFKIKTTAFTGEYPIMLNRKGSFTDVDLNNINAKFNTGSVKVAAYTATPTLTPTPTPSQQVEKMSVVIGSAEAAAGQKVSIPVSFKGVPSLGINNCDFRLSYDTNIFEVESVKVGDIVPESDDGVMVNIDRKGEIWFAWFAYVDSKLVIYPIKSDGLFATINLKVKDGAQAGHYEVKLLKDHASFADIDLSTISTVFNKGSIDVVQSKGFGINVGNVAGVRGETVIVPISFKNVTASGVNNCNFDVLFDSNAFEVIKVEAGSIVPNPNMNFDSYLARKGDIKIVFNDATQMSYPIKNDGIFAKVSLKIKENIALDTYNIKISNIDLADSDLSTIKVENTDISGKVTVAGVVTAQ